MARIVTILIFLCKFFFLAIPKFSPSSGGALRYVAGAGLNRLQQDAGKVREQKQTVIWFVWSIWFVWFFG